MADLEIRSMQRDVTEKEWQTRVDLAACYRLMAVYGMTDMVANHISAAVPDEHGHFLINAYGMLYEEVTASSLYKIDLDGNIVSKPDVDYGLNRAGFVIHSAIHRARHDVGCIIHTHTAAGMAVSALRGGLLPMTQTAMRFAHVPIHEYESVAIDLDEQQRLVADMGDNEAMILRNHGLLVVAPSIPEAFSNIYRLELACKSQLLAQCANDSIVLPPADVIAKTNHLYKPGTRRPFGVLEWPALLRQLDRRDTTYKN
jgi:ribulose-5-phosphate 4-epimerase/fuculose-1-phosphate aldolase